MQKEKKERRSFFRMMAKIGLAGGVGGLLLSRIGDKTFVPPVHAADIVIDATNTGTHRTLLKSNLSASTAVFVGEATSTTGTPMGLRGEAKSPDGTGVSGYVTATTGPCIGVAGTSSSPGGVGVMGINSGSGGAGVYGWAGGSTGVGVVGIGGSSGASGFFQDNVGIGIQVPARALHLQGNNAAFRMDRDMGSSAFILVRTADGDLNTIWKTFYVGVDASGVNNGECFIGDVGNNVAGPSMKRLIVRNNGNVWVNVLETGDIKLANDFIVTEDENAGVAFKNDAGEKIAVLDREGNLQVKGKITENPNL